MPALRVVGGTQPARAAGGESHRLSERTHLHRSFARRPAGGRRQAVFSLKGQILAGLTRLVIACQPTPAAKGSDGPTPY